MITGIDDVTDCLVIRAIAPILVMGGFMIHSFILQYAIAIRRCDIGKSKRNEKLSV